MEKRENLMGWGVGRGDKDGLPLTFTVRHGRLGTTSHCSPPKYHSREVRHTFLPTSMFQFQCRLIIDSRKILFGRFRSSRFSFGFLLVPRPPSAAGGVTGF